MFWSITLSYFLLKQYRVIFEENVTPFILDKEENGDDTDDHGAGNADDNHQAAVHFQKVLGHKNVPLLIELKRRKK